MQEQIVEIIKSTLNEIIPDIKSEIEKSVYAKFSENKLAGVQMQAERKDLNWKEHFHAVLRALASRNFAEFRQLTTGDAAGWVPEEFSKKVVEQIYLENPFRQFGTVFPVSALKGHVPKFVSSVTITRIAEGGTYSETTPTLAQVTWSVEKFGGEIPITEELLKNTAPNLVDVLVRAIAGGFAAKERDLFVNGTGTNEPEGIRRGNFGSNVIDYSTYTKKADALIDAFYALKPQYATRGVWLMSKKAARVVRSLKDAQDRYLWADGLGAQPATLLDRPVYIIPEIPENLGTGNDETEIYFGDFSYYFIFDYNDGQLEYATSEEAGFLKDIIYLKFRKYFDGKMAYFDPGVNVIKIDKVK